MAELADRFERLTVSVVHDVMRGIGIEGAVLPPTIRPLLPERRLAGLAFTVDGHRVSNTDRHTTLLAWSRLLSKVPPGCVLVCQPNDDELALMGELSAEALRLKGVRGYIVDGGCRDVDGLLAIGFQVFCRFFTPSDITGRWLPNTSGHPITIGDVTIQTGDIIFGDRDGVIVVPGDRAEEIVNEAETVTATESAMRRAIKGGMDPEAAYLKFGKF
ncbi:MAG: RraA family protein [Alphaproteobacteria bacterium]|nr:RraA family protein [Alphaproteobacteria bacterium]